jgi:hypothetical protein
MLHEYYILYLECPPKAHVLKEGLVPQPVALLRGGGPLRGRA